MLKEESKEIITQSKSEFEAFVETTEPTELFSNFDQLDTPITIRELCEYLLPQAENRWVIIKNLEKFTGTDLKWLAEKLIGQGDAYLVAKNLEKFKEIDHQRLAHILIEKGDADLVVQNLEKFKGIDHQLLFRTFGPDGHERNNLHLIVSNIEKFKGIDHRELVEKFVNKRSVASGEVRILINYLEKFKGINYQQLAELLVDKGFGNLVAQNLTKFKGINHLWLAKSLVDQKKAIHIFYNLEKFQGIDHKLLVQDLIDQGYSTAVADNLNRLQGIDHQQLAKTLNQKQRSDLIANNLEKFQGINHQQLAEILAAENNSISVATNLQKFEGIDYEELSQNLIKEGSIDAVAARLKYFPGIDHQWLSQRLISQGKIDIVIDYLDNFKGIDHQGLIQAMVDQRERPYKIKNAIDKLKGIDYQWLSQLLIYHGFAYIVAEKLEKFQGIDHQGLAQVLADQNSAYLVLDNIDRFKEIDYKWLIGVLITQKRSHDIAKNLEHFQGINHQWLVQLLVDQGVTYTVADNIEKFREIDYQWLAKVFADEGFAYTIVRNLDKFKGVDHKWLIKVFFDQNTTQIILEYWNEFKDNADYFIELCCSAEEPEIGLFKTLALKDQINKDLFEKFITNLDTIFTGIIPEIIEYQLPSTLLKLSKASEDELNNVIRFCKFNKLYKSLEVIIQHKKYKAKEIGLSWKIVQRDIETLGKDNNPKTAQELCDLATVLFPEKSKEITNIEKALASLSQENSKNEVLEDREPFKELHCTQEIFKYYLSIIFRNTYPLALVPNSLTQEINANISSLFKKVKEYIVVATSSELRHKESGKQKLVASWELKNPVLYSVYSEEKLRVFFENAAKTFQDYSYFRDGYGREPWAIIAELGKKFWRTNIEAMNSTEQIFLLNIAVGVEHNGGYFFDKDERVILESEELKTLLDFEASGQHSIASFLDYGLKNKIITQEEYAKYTSLEKEIKKTVEKLPHDIDTNAFFYERFTNQAQGSIEKILADTTIPVEVKVSIKNIFEKKTGFSREPNGFHYMGKLLRSLNLKWQDTDEVVKKYVDGKNTIYYTEIAGYALGYWYVDGNLQSINSLQEFKKYASAIGKTTRTTIVQAMIGNLREGD